MCVGGEIECDIHSETLKANVRLWPLSTGSHRTAQPRVETRQDFAGYLNLAPICVVFSFVLFFLENQAMSISSTHVVIRSLQRETRQG